MLNLPRFSLSARVGAVLNTGRIDRADGQSVYVTEAEMPDLLVDLAGGRELPDRPKYYEMVLGEWFARKTAPAKMRLVG